MEKRNVNTKNEKKNTTGYAKNHLTPRPQLRTLESFPVPQMSGPITPTQPKKKPIRSTPSRTPPPTSKIGKRQEVKKSPSKVQQNYKKKKISSAAVCPAVDATCCDQARDALYPWTGLPSKSVLVGTQCCLLRGRRRAAVSLLCTRRLRAKLVPRWETPRFSI